MMVSEMDTAIRVLTASGKSSFINKIKSSLTSESIEITVASSVGGLKQCVDQGDHDLVLLHHHFKNRDGLSVLKDLQDWGVQIPIICITPSGDVDYAVQSLQLGAVNYVVEWGDYPRKLPGLFEKATYNYQLKLAYEQAQEKIHSQALLLNYVHDAVVAWDTDNKITYCNFAARTLFGMKAKNCLGKSAETHYFCLFEPEVKLPKEQGTQEFRQERCLTRPDGRKIWVNSRVSYIYDPLEKTKIIGFMDISRDITERKRIDEEMRKAQEKMVESQHLAELGELASGVAHQINNPLTAIIAESQMARRKLVRPHPAHDSLEAIEEAGWKAQQAVSRLLEYTREPKATYQPLSINENIHRALAAIKNHDPELNETIQLQLAHDLPDVVGNAHQLEDLWIKLISGKRGQNGERVVSSITIKTSPWKDKGAIIEVQDDGNVLSQEELDKFFEPDYYQEEDGPGSGLSYSICREIVRQHRGTIRVINQRYQGTSIQVFLPGGEQAWSQPIF